MKKAAIVSILLLFMQVFITAQTADERLNRGMDYVYKLEFDSANSVFQTFIESDPKDPTGYFFQAMTEWWRIYQNKDDRSNDDNYLAKVDRCIKVCEDRLDENEYNDWATFLMGGVIGYRGFMNVMRDNWLKAIDDGKQGLNLSLIHIYKLNLSLRVSDLFDTSQWGQDINAAGYKTIARSDWGSRNFGLNLTFSFGNTDEYYMKKKKTKQNTNEGTDQQDSNQGR